MPGTCSPENIHRSMRHSQSYWLSRSRVHFAKKLSCDHSSSFQKTAIRSSNRIFAEREIVKFRFSNSQNQGT